MTRPVSTLTGPQARQWSARKTRSFVPADELSRTRPRSDLDPLHGAVLLVSGRAPRLGSSLGWVYPAMVTACSVAVLILELFWWVTGADPVVSVVAGVAGLWLFFDARVRVVFYSVGVRTSSRGHVSVIRDVRACS